MVMIVEFESYFRLVIVWLRCFRYGERTERVNGES